ncbi:flagellar assembly peptidoglycan hydrolase FlgJ [Thauera sp. CAU 1555]|uniref:Peptidoglycan hydrolase FlgJ n=1 Tax=Thauera sedimentorum TaxID=2767595 RepID=A0ABR9B8D7_9RHOO|nr:flagellar assembly peptidoglycan hydrolase FlgJ [Thauera sedimentorum]MBC9070793.1 flagellar assembly peptidoglycan hydrolase FlgJ [Thauera sedimentorum]MBD8501712.1 flagellar assembly peptidoglycan hydrolase FlgJ [Thauera sedimentorum]
MVGSGQINVLDPNSMASLKRLAREDNSPEALRGAAKQFEGMFLQMVLKSMRDAMPTDSLFGTEQSRMYQQLLDQQMAVNLAQGRGVGLADVIYRQLGGKDEAAGGSAIDALEAAGGGVFPIDARRSGGAADVDPIFTLINAQRRAASLAGRVPQRDEAGVEAAALAARLSAAIDGARDAQGKIPESAREFVSAVWPHAVQASRKTGIPPQFMVAQAALETGWGAKMLRHADGTPSYNLFNIKAGSGWKGATVDLPVTEYAADGRTYKENARFRSYGSYAEAFADYASLMADSPRYAGVLGQRDAAGFARGLQQAGYATDPMYADKLTRIIGGSTLRTALAG